MTGARVALGSGLLLLGMACHPPVAPRPMGPPARRPVSSSRPAGPALRTPAPQAYLEFLRAELAANLGQRPGATRHYRRALAEDPESPELRLRLAELALQAGRRAAALRFVRAARRVDPDYPRAYLLEARLRQARAPERAARLLREAIALAPRLAGAYLRLAPLARRLGGSAAEQQVYEALLRQRPEHLSAQLGLARSLIRQGRDGAAARALAQACGAHPFAVDPWIALARIRLRQGRWDAAAQGLYEGLEATGDDFTVAEELFRLWLARGQRDRAWDVIVLLEGHQSAAVLTFAAGLRERLGDDAGAAAALARARQQDPGYGPALVALARLVRRRGDPAGARQLLGRVTPKDEPYAAAQLELATQLEAEGQPREAAATLRRLLAVAVAEAGAAESLAFLEARQGRLVLALAALERARRVRGVAADDPGHRYSLTLLYEEAGRWADAARLAEGQLAEDPDDAQVLNLLGYGLAERGLALGRAVALLERSRALDPLNPYVLDSLGWARYRQGRPALAIPWLEQAVQVDRRLCEGWNHLGEALQAAGRWTASRRAWRTALACGLPASTRALVRGRLRGLDAPGMPPEPWAPRARTRRDP